MLVYNKSNFRLVIGCIYFSNILLFGFSGIVYADATESKEPTESHSAVKIPPPIEGIVLDDYRSPATLEKADIYILSEENIERRFTVELASTEQEQRTGMMFRRHIAKNSGMLFLFNGNKERSFWMRNTFIPLDLLFIRSDGIIHHIHPMAEVNSLKRISSNGAVSAVLEIEGGTAETLGVHVGDRVLYKAFTAADSN